MTSDEILSILKILYNLNNLFATNYNFFVSNYNLKKEVFVNELLQIPLYCTIKFQYFYLENLNFDAIDFIPCQTPFIPLGFFMMIIAITKTTTTIIPAIKRFLGNFLFA